MWKYNILKIPKLNRWMEIVVSILIPTLLIFALYQRVGIFFETNDDRIIMSLLAGVMTGMPDSHPFFLNYFLWLPLQGLYRMTNSVPWYGLFLVGCWLVCLIAVLYCAINKCKNLISQIVVIILSGAVFLSFIYALGLIQFTSTAALLATSGYICLIIDHKSVKNNAFFFILELLACFLRLESMLMVQPLGILALAFAFLVEWCEEDDIKKTFQLNNFVQKFVKPFSMLICIFLILLAGFFFAYHTNEWRDFKNFSAARSLLVDYCEKTPYSEIAPILEKYEISEKKYDAFWAGVIMDWDGMTECVVELAEYADAKRDHISIGNALEGYVWKETVASAPWNINHVIWLAWILLLVGIMMKKCWCLFIPAGLFAITRMAIWTYLYYNGRLPMRVAVSMFMIEIMLLMTLSLHLRVQEENHKPVETVVFLLLLIIFTNRAFLTGRAEYRYIAEQNRGQNEYIRSMREVINYCNERNSECFLLEPTSFSYYKGSVFDVSLSEHFNGLYIGGWFYPAPNVQRYLKNEMNAAEGFSVIVYEDSDWENAPLNIYLEENTGVSGQLTDHFEVSFGGAYDVYRFERNFVFQ